MKIDIIHATAGEGHRKIAMAVQDAFMRVGRNDIQTRLLNALDYTSAEFQKTYTPLYFWSVKHAPMLWGAAYELLDWPWVSPCVAPFRALYNSEHGAKLLEEIQKNKSDVVISTHFFAPELLGRAKLKGQIQSKLVTVITDFYPHAVWVNPGTDHYWGMCEETKMDLLRRGVPIGKITAGGIPVHARFKPAGKKQEYLQKHGLQGGRFTLLLTSGSFGLGPQEKILELLKDFQDKVQCFVVCANNKDMKAALESKSYPYPVKVFGFIDFMDELMEASDLMVAKPGGSTTSESLSKGVPMVIIKPIPGQETRNAQLLKSRNAAFFMNDPEELHAIVKNVLEHPGELEAKRHAICELGRPDAGDDLVKTVLMLK